MPMKDAVVRTLQELASSWRCELTTNPAQTKFLFKSSQMPTRCLIYRSLQPAVSWDRNEFEDSVIMRWERFLGRVTEALDPYSLLTEDYRLAPPFYGMCEVEGRVGLFLVDFLRIPWTLSDQDIFDLIAGRYALGLYAEPIKGVVLQFSKFESVFWMYAKDA